MATTNIIHARINGKPVDDDQITIGLVVDYPSGMGGTIRCICTQVTAEKAVFKPLDENAPAWAGFTAQFNQDDFTLSEFKQLAAAIVSFNRLASLPNDEERAIVRRAQALGYASNPSYTQASWLERGIDMYKRMKTTTIEHAATN